MEVRHSSRWEKGVSWGVLELISATLVRLLELVEADAPKHWRQMGERGEGGERTVLLGAD